MDGRRGQHGIWLSCCRTGRKKNQQTKQTNTLVVVVAASEAGLEASLSEKRRQMDAASSIDRSHHQCRCCCWIIIILEKRVTTTCYYYLLLLLTFTLFAFLLVCPIQISVFLYPSYFSWFQGYLIVPRLLVFSVQDNDTSVCGERGKWKWKWKWKWNGEVIRFASSKLEVASYICRRKRIISRNPNILYTYLPTH